MAGGRLGGAGVDDPGQPDEGEARAPGSADQSGGRGSAGRRSICAMNSRLHTDEGCNSILRSLVRGRSPTTAIGPIAENRVDTITNPGAPVSYTPTRDTTESEAARGFATAHLLSAGGMVALVEWEPVERFRYGSVLSACLPSGLPCSVSGFCGGFAAGVIRQG